MAENTSAGGGTGAGTRGGLVPRLIETLLRRQEISIFVVAVALVIYFQASNPAFLETANLRGLSQSIAATAIVAAGLVMVMILGEIDLSVGQAFAFAPIMMYIAYEQFFLVLPLAVLIGLLMTAVVGLINGVFRVYFAVPSFVATLGMYFLLGGINVILVGGFPKTTPETSSLTLSLGEYPYSGIIWCAAVFLFMHVLLNYTRWGIYTFATGGNFIGAKEAGIKVDRVRIVNFMICSMLAGLAGILEAYRIESIDPLAGGAGVMFLAISAAVIGGTPLAGGVGTMIGAFIGTLVLSVLRNGFTLQGIGAFTFNIILGIAVLVVMVLNIYVGRLRVARRTT